MPKTFEWGFNEPLANIFMEIDMWNYFNQPQQEEEFIEPQEEEFIEPQQEEEQINIQEEQYWLRMEENDNL